ncbi:MAG: ATP-binding cassette domain-containing protein [Deltaproteobacteria bacterium]|nr:ATP-binding cassette domain-containing protein [Deltaproteobacteria bacterium]
MSGMIDNTTKQLGSVAISARSLTKRFGHKVALDDVSLDIERGSIHALLGPNGAGKTTFVKILSTLLSPTLGEARILGSDVHRHPDEIKERISLTGQSASVDEEMTGYENVYLLARLLGLPKKDARMRTLELLTFFELFDAQNKLVKFYSGGMRRRLDIAASIIRKPEILFLDEPTTGLDPGSRNRLWRLIKNIAQSGTTVLLTTQYLEEADQLADEISVIDNGRLIYSGTGDTLKSSVGTNMLHISWSSTNDDETQRAISVIEEHITDSARITLSPHGAVVSVTSTLESTQVLAGLSQAGIPVLSYALSRPTLDEAFLALTGNPAAESGDAPSDDIIPDNTAASASNKAPSLASLSLPVVHSAGALTDIVMLGWRSLVKIKHIPEQFTDVLVTPVMFMFMFAFLLGGALAGSVDAYLSFLVPGMLVQTLTFNSVYSGMNIHTDIHKGIFDRFKSMPIWSASPFLGLFVGDCLRHLISGVFLLLVSTFIGFRFQTDIWHVGGALLLIAVFALSVSWIFITLGLLMRSISAVMSTSWMILMPLVFLSNIYAEPSTMPNWLQTWISMNPVTWQVDAARALMGGDVALPLVLKALLASVVFTGVFAPLVVFIYRRER